MAAWCIGFAAVNAAQQVTGSLAAGPYAAYASGLSVMAWLVFGLKLLGAAVALLCVSRRLGPVPPYPVAVGAWGATALLGVYSLGSVVEAIGMATGLRGSIDQITLAGVAYVVFFLLGALGYGVLAVSFSRRYGTGTSAVVAGALGAPVVLALVLLGIPSLLVALGVMPG